jgi:hypothetical protein
MNVPGDFGVVQELGSRQVLRGDGLLDDGRHVSVGLADPGITLDFGSSSQTQRLEKD